MTLSPRFRLRYALGVTGLLASLLSACSPTDPVAETTAALAQNVLLPSYTQWLSSNQQLLSSAQAFCSGKQSLAEARQQFVSTQNAWASLQAMLLGPLSETNRLWQIQFWPDKKNLVARQVESLLQNKPSPSKADVESGSVVTQGLSAYEYILFDPAAQLNDPQRKPGYCALAVAISEHQQHIAADILQQWQEDKQGLAAQLRQFPNSRYADAREALGDLLRVQITALDGLKKKLGLPLGRPGQGIAQPYQAEAWRSNASLSSLAASLIGAERLWQGTGNDGLRHLLPNDKADLAKRLDQSYAKVGGQLQKLESHPMSELLASDDGRADLNTLYDSLNELHRLHQGDLANALGIQIGFNAHDGD